MQEPGNPLSDMGALPPIAGLVFEMAPIAALAGDTQLFGGPCILGGWALTGDNGVAANVHLYDGQNPNGPFIALPNITAGGSQITTLPGNGVHFQRGLYVRVVSGNPSGFFFLYPGIPE